MTFNEQASLKNLAFLSTLIRVFLQAGFQTQEGGISQAIQLVRKSSSIADENDLHNDGTRTEDDQFVKLMKSTEGQEVMLNTDFEKLFDKVMQILATILAKPGLIFEDKILIENALSILVGILLYRKNIYTRFISFSAQGEIQNAEQLCLAGLLG